MIEELHIRDLGVIEDVALRLAPGLTVVTGETGAGKTMLVTALQLLLGARADSSLVRRGSKAAVVEAELAPPPEEAQDWLEDDEPLVVSREVRSEGRSRARIAGRLAPVSVLSEVLGSHIEVHAQHEHVRLARPDVQRRLLDRFAGDPHARTLANYRETHQRWSELRERRERLDQDARERARELDRLRAEVAEIDAARLDPEVDAELDLEVERLAHADEIERSAQEVAAALGSEGAQVPVGHALDAVRRLHVDDDQLHALRERVEGVAAELAELTLDVRAYGESIASDPERLATLQDRKHLLSQLTRKYGVDIPAVLGYADEARASVDALVRDEADAEQLDEQLDEARGELRRLADDLHRGRTAAGERLAEVVGHHLGELGMPHARCEILVEALDDDSFTADGADRVTFLLAANPGEPARPLAQAASGGERSRVSLAIEVALADVDDAKVLVFDEVDAGVGGATAMAVGEKLARLAAGSGSRQVLCVTHLAQLAAFADVHHVVEKGVRDGRTVTTARQVADDDRVSELSRMLGGDAAAAAGRDHARELLDTARQRRAS